MLTLHSKSVKSDTLLKSLMGFVAFAMTGQPQGGAPTVWLF
jgi:hypothetical protein